MKYFKVTYVSQKTLHPEGYKTFHAFVEAETKHTAKLKALEVLAQEAQAWQQRQPLEVFSSQPYGAHGITQPWLFCFLPDVNDCGVCHGSFCHARPFPFLSLLDYLEGGCPRPLEDWHVDDRFSDRERGILFLSLQRLSSKRIGLRLQISHRTVENRLQGIYQKRDIHNVRQRDDYCRLHGMMFAIPPQWRPRVSHVINP